MCLKQTVTYFDWPNFLMAVFNKFNNDNNNNQIKHTMNILRCQIYTTSNFNMFVYKPIYHMDFPFHRPRL